LEELTYLATKISQTDLLELLSRPINEIIEDAREIYNNLKQYEKECYGIIPRSVYEHGLSILKFALLKLSTVLEDKLKGQDIKDEFTNFIIGYFTPDEKNALKELERFSKLEPNVTPPETLADIIVAEHGKIYEIIKEAISKEYVDLGRVLETWKSNLKIRNDIARAFEIRYRERFNNIIDAIKNLLDQQPAWLKRLFREYEDALLSSEDIRRRFEEEYRKVFIKELETVEEKLKGIGDEKKSLQMIFENLDPKIKDLEKFRELLENKLKELEELKVKQPPDSVAKVALELAINNLKGILTEYENKIQEYEFERDKLRDLEMADKGGIEGHAVSREIIDLFSERLIGRARRIMEEGKIKLYNPQDKNELLVDRWDKIERLENSTIHTNVGSINFDGIAFTKMKGVIFKKPYIIVEYLTLSHPELLKLKGYDSKPLDVSDFLAVLKTRIVEAEKGKYYHIIVLSSPTGFTDTLKNHVGGEIFWKNFASKYVTVYLLDPVTGELKFNEGDSAAQRNRFIANIELPEEQVERVVKYLSSEEAMMKAIENSPVMKFLKIDQIAEATGVQDKCVIQRASEILKSKKVGEIKEVYGNLVFVYERGVV
jgi:predicted regulator of amino acid metabolism with ACT domain